MFKADSICSVRTSQKWSTEEIKIIYKSNSMRRGKKIAHITKIFFRESMNIRLRLINQGIAHYLE